MSKKEGKPSGLHPVWLNLGVTWMVTTEELRLLARGCPDDVFTRKIADALKLGKAFPDGDSGIPCGGDYGGGFASYLPDGVLVGLSGRSWHCDVGEGVKEASGYSLGEHLLGIMRRRFPRRVRRLRDGKYAVRYRETNLCRVYTLMTLELRSGGFPVVEVEYMEPSVREVRSVEGFIRALDKAAEVMGWYRDSGKRLKEFRKSVSLNPV